VDVPGGTVKKVREIGGPGFHRKEETVVRSYGAPEGADPVSRLEQEVQASWAGHTGLKAKVRTAAYAGDAEARRLARTEGTYELEKAAGKVRLRIELKGENVPGLDAKELTEKSEMLQVIDGDYTYLLSTVNGVRKARKTNIDVRDTGEPRAVLAAYREGYKLSRKPDATVGDRKTYVVEAVRRTSDPEQRQRVCLYFDQVSGFLLQVERYLDGPKPVSTFTLSDVQLDADLPDDHFQFTAPEGIKVEEALTR